MNAFTSGDQNESSAAVLADGGFVVFWAPAGQDDVSGNGYDIYAQRYDANAVKIGDATLVNTATADNQTNPTITVLSDGSFVITWDSTGNDTSMDGVFV